MTQDPHAHKPTLSAGPLLDDAAAALVLVHGRGATAASMLSLYEALAIPGMAAVAPQAAGNTWYPNSFLAPLATNQPWLDSALKKLDSTVADLLARGTPSDRLAILGFSQGACLTLEYAARHPRRFGAVIGFTGGLIGAPGTLRTYSGSLDRTPVFLGASDPDPHVPFQRVEETASILGTIGAIVDLRRYPGMSHTINDDELQAARDLLGKMPGRQS